MRRLAYLLAAATGAAALAAGLVLPAAASASTGATVSVTTSITSRDDSGNNGNWAVDTITRTASVTSDGLQVGNTDCGTLSPCYAYTGFLSDSGTFAGVSGDFSPQAGVAEDAPNVAGPMSGGAEDGTGTFTFYANSAAPSATGVPADLSGDADSTSTWMALFFPAGTLFSSSDGIYPATADLLPAWSWSYSDPKTCENWTDAASNGDGSLPADGDITGTDRCTTSVTSPGNQSTPANTPVHLAIAAATSSSDTALSYSMTGAPAGLSISPSTGVITGTPETVESSDVATVTVTDWGGLSAATTFGWNVTPEGTYPTPVLKSQTAYDNGTVNASFTDAATGVTFHYQVCADPTSGGCPVSKDTTTPSTSTSVSLHPLATGLKAGKTYEWRVAVNAGTEHASAWSAWRVFTVPKS